MAGPTSDFEPTSTTLPGFIVRIPTAVDKDIVDGLMAESFELKSAVEDAVYNIALKVYVLGCSDAICAYGTAGMGVQHVMNVIVADRILLIGHNIEGIAIAEDLNGMMDFIVLKDIPLCSST